MVENTIVHVRERTSLVVQFQAKYTFTGLRVYYPPSSGGQTKLQNCFLATVQCLASDGKNWTTVGHIDHGHPSSNKRKTTPSSVDQLDGSDL